MYEIYKPFRNRLRGVSVWESLHTVFRFIQFLDFKIPLPKELEAPPLLSLRDQMRWGIVQWEFEILAREIIMNGDKYSKRHLNSWQDIAREINTIKRLENDTWGMHSQGGDEVLHELVRIAHRQFPWQKGVTQHHIARYSRLYEYNGLSDMIEAEYGMSHAQMLQLGVALSGHFLKNYTLALPIKNEINNVSQDVCDKFIKRFSSTFDEIKEDYKTHQAYDINWAYTFNPLRKKPLIRISESLAICPIPTFLLRRLTNEIYFDLVPHEKEFSRHFGPAVQDLVGAISIGTDLLDKFSVISEVRYGPKNKRKDTVDWLISDSSGTIFVECKGARIHYRGISDLTERSFIDSEFSRIKEFTLQLYKTLYEALRGEYPNWKPNGKPVFPVIVTLEDWQTFGIHVNKLVLDPLKIGLRELGIDPAIVDQNPPSFCAVDTFEMAMHVCNVTSIATVFQKKNEGEYPQWALDTFLVNNFSKEISNRKPLFSEQWNKLVKHTA